MNPYLKIHPEVAQALQAGKPVVALESTIISHGMPYPQNLQTAQEVEGIVRKYGAIPATIGIIHGELCVGLSPEQLHIMATAPNIAKVSRRDMPFIVAQKTHGATTVASTMIIAEMAGISVFVTGGIGGVHRDAPNTFDISADLTELAQTNVAVVCAGIKSILDLPLTLEYLETLGVPVIGYQTDDLPAFYTRTSGNKLLHRADTPDMLAAIMHAKWQMQLRGGLVIANPIPEEHALDADIMHKSIEKALKNAKKLGISGKDATPFLLAEVKKITAGKSLDANIQLVYNNARLGALVAVSYAHKDA